MRRRYHVIVAPRAAGQLEHITGWWSINRPEVPDLFANEFEAAANRVRNRETFPRLRAFREYWLRRGR